MMKKVMQDIAESFGNREKRLEEIQRDVETSRKSTRDMVSSLNSSRQSNTARLRRELMDKRYEAASGVKELRSETGEMVSGFNQMRKEQGDKMHQELGRAAKDLELEVGKITESSRQTLVGCRFQRLGMSKDLRGMLAQSASTRKSGVARLRSEARNLVQGFSNLRRETSHSLKKSLADARQTRETKVNKMRDAIRLNRAGLRSAIKEDVTAWREMTKDLRAKGNGKGESLPGEPAHDFEAKLIEVIGGHPEGITLTDAAESLHTAPVVFGRAVKSLIEKGKIRKEDKLYFPV